ncbi:MAG: MFS transporter, partial [Deltaproteobacteria bacterium]|nr:MFS transporter [Deltaproteobacteria bacterium]
MDTTHMFSMNIGDENRFFYYGWVITSAGLVILTVETGIMITFGIFFKPILAEFGWTTSRLSGVFSAFMIVRILSSLALGYLADRFGVRLIVILGAALAAIALFLTSTFSALWQLYVYYSLLFSIGTSCAYIPMTSNVSKWFRKKRGLATGIMVMGLGLGSLIMSPFTGFLISSYGWRQSYVILGIILFVALVGSALFLRDPPEDQRKDIDVQVGKSRSLSLEDNSYRLGQAACTQAFWMQGMSWFFLSVGLYSILVHIVSYAISIDISTIKASAILGMTGGFSLLGRVAMGFISDKLGRKRSVIFASFISVFALMVIAVSQNLVVFYVACSMFGFSYGGWGAQMPAMPADYFGERNSGTILGGIFLVGGAGMAVGPWVAGHIIDLSGSYKYLFLMASVASLIG